ncbi:MULTISPECIES: adenylyltransferase/cytidyltransferase family protein [unclassified Roseateles]|uniref:adenylyltransferase/cytidyltransferase family protein n=1 Tax=Pelomonas sp. Root1237 TaxID=1736434 RepID=UPI00190FF2A2|nr:adenylyltransferase/cytidyltransferase family protein [Pelomonas sp. Root1237]
MQSNWNGAFKCLAPEQLIERLAWLERPLVFTNGVFDLLHVGHVSCLEAARRQGNVLVVALNSDASAHDLGKPGERPCCTLHERAHVIAALSCVNWVTWFEEATPAALLQAVRPDVYVKGSDHAAEQLPETPLVRGWGGRVVTVPYLAGHSAAARRS